MQTTSTTRPVRFSGAIRTLLMTMGLTLLVLTSSHPVGATQLPPATAGEAQAIACGWMGGHATVEVTRNRNGVSRTLVACSVPGLGGWWCVNTATSTVCEPLAASTQQPNRWLDAVAGQVLPVLETGTISQMQTATAAFQASPLVQAELSRVEQAAASSQDQAASSKDRKHHKQKQHKQKHGGKHGKGRKH